MRPWMFFAASRWKLRKLPWIVTVPTIGAPVSASSTAVVPPKQ